MKSGNASAVLSLVMEHVEVEVGIGALHTNDTNEGSSENQLELVVIPDVPLTI